ncbi:hypothetical protein OKW46_005281 [Paraburkholderia sp. WSM4179]|uniref:hypothetical protein n=1 Tax=Paraburkholderia sp. WSM4179 TaxID=2991073 RepID=UPI0013A6E1F6|nr:hypothetical protein [Paraburkholderia sp. WSM4179]MDH6151356.1 hypothetical protein [Paraburkholderia sp. WSM4179]
MDGNSARSVVNIFSAPTHLTCVVNRAFCKTVYPRFRGFISIRKAAYAAQFLREQLPARRRGRLVFAFAEISKDHVSLLVDKVEATRYQALDVTNLLRCGLLAPVAATNSC